MLKYVGNCSSIIDWTLIIKEIENQKPAYVGPSHKEGDNIPGLDPVVISWKKAGFKTVAEGGTVSWDMFLPGVNFNKSVVEKFIEFVGIESYTSAWISRINVGRFAPWHWDVHDDEIKLSKKTGIRRFHCHITEPQFGHILLVEDECFYNKNLGDVYEWPSRTCWHAGMNCGLVPKYLFNIW